MRVALVTNWDEKCAVAEYARNLTEYCLKADKEVSFKVVTRPLIYENVWEAIKDVDVVHFNYCAHAFKDMAPDGWKNFRTIKPVVMTVHESSDWMVRRLAKTEIADVFIQHDQFRDGLPELKNVVTIPYGVPEVDVSDVKVERKVGTFGCAFPWKGLVPLAHACGQLGYQLELWLSEPDSDPGQMDWRRMKEEILQYSPTAKLNIGWQSQTEIIRSLATCAVIALPFEPCSPITGISASVRFALAAKRPLVLTKFFHFADLYGYENEVYFAETLSNLRSEILRVLHNISEMRPNRRHGPRMPQEILKDMKWSVAAQKYVDLYRKVTSGQSISVGQS